MSDLSKFFSRRSFRTAWRGMRRYVAGPEGRRRVRTFRLLYKLRMEVILRTGMHRTFSTIRDVRLWEDGEVFPRVEKLLKRAMHTVLIQMFIWKDDELGRRIATVILRCAERGVQVDITKEAVGDTFEFDRDFMTTQMSDDSMWKRFWHHPNIHVTHASELDHGKTFIIDGSVLLLTGMNIANEYHEKWHDYMVELRGAKFVEQYLSGGEIVPSGPIRLVLNTNDRKDIRPVLHKILTDARESIVVEHCYLADPQVVDILAKRSHDGLRVTIILSSKVDFHFHANMQSVSELMGKANKEHLRVVLYPRMIHGKIILIDKEVAYIGSANLMTTSLDQMGELNVLIYGKHRTAIRKLREILRRDILRSRPVDHTPFRYGIHWWLSILRL